MKKWIGFTVTLVLLFAGFVLSQTRKVDAPAGPNAVLYLVADTERELTRLPMAYTRIADADEVKIGDRIAGLEQPKLDDEDKLIEGYVQAVGSRVAVNAHRKLPYKFHYIPERYFINAFALPGGHVYMGAGLLELMDNEDELAAVLGHEIEHIDHYHCAERLQVEAALRKMPLGELAAIPIELFQAGYNKDQELEADREGTRLAVRAGYSPEGAILLHPGIPPGSTRTYCKFIRYNAGSVSALLQVDGLNVTFTIQSGEVAAVRDVSFSIPESGTLGLVGESGSGKSATSLAIMRLLSPQARISGSIAFADANLLGLAEDSMRRMRGAGISMIFQEPMTALNPVMRVGDQVAEAVLAHDHLSKREAWQRAVEALHEVAIPEPGRRARDYPHQLSGGQRQRVMIAMALVNHPRLLIADEPTTALDVTIQAQILDLLRELRDRHKLAVLFISHDLGVISRVADRVAVMYAGEIVEMGEVRQIFSAASHPYTRGLIRAIPTLRSDRNRPLETVERQARPGKSPGLRQIAPGHWARVAP